MEIIIREITYINDQKKYTIEMDDEEIIRFVRKLLKKIQDFDRGRTWVNL